MEFQQDLQSVLLTLEQGGLILYPTDTIWGIGCDATNPKAVEKVYQLKQRANEKAMIVLVADQVTLLKHVNQLDHSMIDFLKNVQKPTTVIYEGAKGLAANLLAADGSVGIRLVSEPFLHQLILKFGKPIVSTSANISGENAPANYSQVSEVIKKGVDYIVQYRQDDDAESKPSSVVKLSSKGIEILRP